MSTREIKFKSYKELYQWCAEGKSIKYFLNIYNPKDNGAYAVVIVDIDLNNYTGIETIPDPVAREFVWLESGHGDLTRLVRDSGNYHSLIGQGWKICPELEGEK